ncbi:MAG: hypothetical protein IJT60_05110 [Clostridia bacterium]|nr:hypothetical protein [Clostridia bacterium]
MKFKDVISKTANPMILMMQAGKLTTPDSQRATKAMIPKKERPAANKDNAIKTLMTEETEISLNKGMEETCTVLKTDVFL